MSLNNRVFTTPHYHVDFGYDGLRGFDTRLSHTITQHFSYEGYDVELRDTVRGNRRFELWSPNFSTIPMYPGTPPPNFSMTPPLRCLRVDGSGGRYDCTLFPQHPDTNRHHLPFIIRPGQGLRERLVEFRTLPHSPGVWKPAHLGPTKGCISAGYLKSLSERAVTLESARIALLPSISAAHPDWAYIKTLVDAHPTPAEISRFTTITDWESFLHGLAHIQRQLREKAAWVHMCEALKHTCWSLDVNVNSNEALAVREREMGAWVNGAPKSAVSWLLKLGIPCFIIHEYREGVDFGAQVPERRNLTCKSSFYPEPFDRKDNPYENIAMRGKTTWLDEIAILPGGPHIEGRPEEFARSSSSEHGYCRPQSCLYLPQDAPFGSITWPSELVYPDRVPWYRPPPVAPEWKKSWERFEEQELSSNHPRWKDVKTVMVWRGKKARIDAEAVLYDRTLGRTLYFQTLDSIQGVVDVQRYGRPVPYYHFVTIGQGNDPMIKQHRRSTWGYAKQKPDQLDVGRTLDMPDANSLHKHSATPKTLGLDDNAEDESDDGLSSYVPPNQPTLPPSPSPSDQMAPLDYIPEVEMESSALSVFTTPASMRGEPPAVDDLLQLSHQGKPRAHSC